MPMSSPAWIAWKRKAECMASRTVLLPLKENETFEIPPLTLTPGRVALILAGGLDEGNPVLGVLLDARAHGQDVRIDDDVLGRESDLVREDAHGPGQDRHTALGAGGLALLVEGHHHDPRPVAAHTAGMLPEGVLAFLSARWS